MSPVDIHWWLNLGTALGIAVLAIPVWSLNFKKKRLQQVRVALPEEPSTFRERIKGILRDKHNRDVADWRRLDEICLWVGYGLLLGSSLARLIVPAIEAAPIG